METEPADKICLICCKENCRDIHTYSDKTLEFIKKAREKHGWKYSYEKSVYVDASIRVIIICFKHGEFKQKIEDHVYNSMECGQCTEETYMNFFNFLVCGFCCFCFCKN